jgi:hypothetical protein
MRWMAMAALVGQLGCGDGDEGAFPEPGRYEPVIGGFVCAWSRLPGDVIATAEKCVNPAGPTRLGEVALTVLQAEGGVALLVLPPSAKMPAASPAYEAVAAVESGDRGCFPDYEGGRQCGVVVAVTRDSVLVSLPEPISGYALGAPLEARGGIAGVLEYGVTATIARVARL